MIKVGIIGGTGLEDPQILKNPITHVLGTPYGNPSSPLLCGQISGVNVIIISRHGPKHTLSPSEVNYRANIHALKEQGCTHIIATTACGSLREEIKPGDFVFPTQFIDRTTKRMQTFYEHGRICHIPMAQPFCSKLIGILQSTANLLNIMHHDHKTTVTIEGPRFSTKAESLMFRSWGADIVNMTTVPEAVLAREAGICYASIAMATDYDCWHESEEAVSLEMVMKTMKANADRAKELIIRAIN